MSKYFLAGEGEADDEYYMVLVFSEENFQKPDYYGVNVLFYPDGKIDASCGDSMAQAEWDKDRKEIIKVAFKFDPEGILDMHGKVEESTQPAQVNKLVPTKVKEVYMDPKEHLMTVLQSLIHDKQDDAKEAIRQAILAKSQSIVGSLNGSAQAESVAAGNEGEAE